MKETQTPWELLRDRCRCVEGRGRVAAMEGCNDQGAANEDRLERSHCRDISLVGHAGEAPLRVIAGRR